MIQDNEKRIAEKYLLPKRPFLYGMTSAFDMFGVFGRGRSEQLLANLQEDMRRRSERDILKRTWSKVGLHLFNAMEQYDMMERESVR